MLDADDFTLRKLVPIVRAGGVPGAAIPVAGGTVTTTAATGGAAGAAGAAAAATAPTGEAMIRDAPGR